MGRVLIVTLIWLCGLAESLAAAGVDGVTLSDHLGIESEYALLPADAGAP